MVVSLNILCSNPLNSKNKITKIEHKKIFCSPSKIFKNPLAPHPTYIIYGPLSCFPLAIKDSVRTSKTRVFEIPKQVTWIAFMWYFAERRIDYMPQQIICIIFGCSAVTFSCKHSYKHLHYPNKGMLNFKKCLTNFVPKDIASFWE